MSEKGPLKNFDIVFLEDLYKKIERNKNLFFIRLSECYCDPLLDEIFKELEGRRWKACTEDTIIYLSSERLREVYLQYNFKKGEERVIYSGTFKASQMISPIIDNLYNILDFNRSIHFSSNKALVEKIEEKGTEVLQKLGVETKDLFEKSGRGNIFSFEVEKNDKISKYLWNKEEVRESVPSYFNIPSRGKMKKLEMILKEAMKQPIYLKEPERWGKVRTRIGEEMEEIQEKMNKNSGALYLPFPFPFSPGKDSIFYTKRIKADNGILIRKLSPIAITSETFYGYPNKSKKAQIVKMAFLHRYGVYRHENKDFGDIDIHLLEPILIVEYTDIEDIPFEVITSQEQEGSKDERYRVFLIETPKKFEGKENTKGCENKKKVGIKYRGFLNIWNGSSIGIETSGESTIEIDPEKGEAKKEDNQSTIWVGEQISERILNWVLHETKPPEPSQKPPKPPSPLVIIQVLREVAEGYIPEQEKNKEIPKDYLEGVRRRYYQIYYLFYDWLKKIIRSIDADSHELPKEVEGVKVLAKMVKQRLKGKEEFLERVSNLCIKMGKGEQLTITVDFEKDNLRKLDYSWGEKASLVGITPLKIDLPIGHIIGGKEYLLLFPKSDEEKLRKMDEVRSINIVIRYIEKIESRNNEKVEINVELEILSIELEFCDGTKISGRSNKMTALLKEENKLTSRIEIRYNPEEVTEKLKNLVKSLMEERARRRG